MLVKDDSDDDTREFVRGILKEAMPNPRLGAVVFYRLFVLVDAIKKQRKKKQQKQGNMTNATPMIASQPSNTKTRPTTTTKKTNTPPKD